MIVHSSLSTLGTSFHQWNILLSFWFASVFGTFSDYDLNILMEWDYPNIATAPAEYSFIWMKCLWFVKCNSRLTQLCLPFLGFGLGSSLCWTSLRWANRQAFVCLSVSLSVFLCLSVSFFDCLSLSVFLCLCLSLSPIWEKTSFFWMKLETSLCRLQNFHFKCIVLILC